MSCDSATSWNREEFTARLRGQGERYHIHHPFHVRMYAGELNRQEIQGWVANRFCYQINIPRKDAAIMANCPDREVRRLWIRSASGADMEEREALRLDAGQGVEGDHTHGTKRHVTLIFEDDWAAACATLGRDVDPSCRRANVLLSEERRPGPIG